MTVRRGIRCGTGESGVPSHTRAGEMWENRAGRDGWSIPAREQNSEPVKLRGVLP